jgi:hypothetical protein
MRNALRGIRLKNAALKGGQATLLKTYGVSHSKARNIHTGAITMTYVSTRDMAAELAETFEMEPIEASAYLDYQIGYEDDVVID